MSNLYIEGEAHRAFLPVSRIEGTADCRAAPAPHIPIPVANASQPLSEPIMTPLTKYF